MPVPAAATAVGGTAAAGPNGSLIRVIPALRLRPGPFSQHNSPRPAQHAAFEGVGTAEKREQSFFSVGGG